MSSKGPLHGLRVVEMTDAMGAYAGKLLADLGADVVLVEPPEGSAVRAIGPFMSGYATKDAGLLHHWMDTNKRSFVADCRIAAEQEEVDALIARADLLLLSGQPADLQARGLHHARLRNLNPRLVVTAVTPFGSSGPLSNFAADDLVLLAMGGLLSLGGYPDTAPTAVHGYQSYLAGSLFAVVGSLVALEVAERTGRGQFVDVSIQDCVAQALETAAQAYDLVGSIRRRVGAGQQDAGLGIFPCADGLVSIVIGLSGGEGGSSWDALADWLSADPEASTFREPCWRDGAFRATSEARARFAEIFGRFASGLPKKQLYVEGQQRGLSVSAIATMADLAADDQLSARDFFQEVSRDGHPLPFRYPGPPYRFSRTPAGVRTQAPGLGEHTAAIREEWLRSSEITAVPSKTGSVRMEKKPLSNVRIADFTWVGAGPFATKPLADFGADVIKVESSKRPDPTRLSPPFARHPGVDRSGYFANRNSSKQSICLDIKRAEGLALARALLKKSDIVANNYRAGVMERLGLGYAEAAKVRPDIIYLDMPAFGNEGPARDFGGFGAAIAAACGLHYLSGTPDRLPVGTGTHYPDHILNPLHAAIALLAALRHRRLTGEGQHVELAQFESSVNGVGYALLTYLATGQVMERQGNHDGINAPRAVLRCLGDDRWCAISVMDNRQWKALCHLVGREDWQTSAILGSVAGRLANQEELEQGLEEWTRQHDPYEVMSRCQAAGIPCGVVQTAADVVDRDPSLRMRHWVYLDHPEMGHSLYDGPCAILSDTPARLHSPAPILGADTSEVLARVLGCSEEAIVTLQESGVLA
ncbi:MAG: CaiB/BaiF CoA transferase family protein [Gammaproteobacteria bacterium]